VWPMPMRQCEGAVVSLGGLHMFTHTLGKHPMCHTSRLQHDGLGSHLNLNFIYAKIKGANKAGKTADSSVKKAEGRQPANI
jgi:hypothetical protein